MSEWKNPSFPSSSSEKQWHTPVVKDDVHDDVRNSALIIGLAVKMVVGAVALVGFNALFFFGAFRIIGYDVDYRKCVLLALLYIVFRAYDRTTLGKHSG